MAKTAKRKPGRNNLEATMVHVRSLKKAIAALERRVQRLERRG